MFQNGRTIVLATLAVALPFLLSSGRASAQIVIDNSVIVSSDKDIVVDVAGIRPMSDWPLEDAVFTSRLKFSRDLLLEAAYQFDETRQELIQLDKYVDEITFHDIKWAVINSDYLGSHLYQDLGMKIIGYNASNHGHRYPKIVSSDIAENKSLVDWDASTLLNMVGTGVLDISNVTIREIGSKKVELVGFSEEYKVPINIAYGALLGTKNTEFHDVFPTIQTIRSVVREYPSLEKSLLKSIGKITFGYPIIYTSNEKELALPRSIDKNFDVYWLDLSATFRQLSSDELVELAVNFGLPQGCIALALIPLSYGNEVENEEIINTPDISIGAGPAQVSIGEFFRQTVRYQYIKPVIISFGLQENSFAWTLQKEAVRAGAHRFAAIIAVPKGRKSVKLEMSAHVRVDQKLLLGESLAGTDVHQVSLHF